MRKRVVGNLMPRQDNFLTKFRVLGQFGPGQAEGGLYLISSQNIQDFVCPDRIWTIVKGQGDDFLRGSDAGNKLAEELESPRATERPKRVKCREEECQPNSKQQPFSRPDFGAPERLQLMKKHLIEFLFPGMRRVEF